MEKAFKGWWKTLFLQQSTAILPGFQSLFFETSYGLSSAFLPLWEAQWEALLQAGSLSPRQTVWLKEGAEDVSTALLLLKACRFAHTP